MLTVDFVEKLFKYLGMRSRAGVEVGRKCYTQRGRQFFFRR
ncbi:hypothetical protein LT85_3130 [Collimonas arenae]|uniref:Uncharacterized protein n=1 Tax=Collimonas arenae TaxID=279058 RepID=A0A0A1FC34_9BURK|nr:hypothetical protein LT85_3130 [Collimonas arenae]